MTRIPARITADQKEEIEGRMKREPDILSASLSSLIRVLSALESASSACHRLID
jgi:hypothetical protein